MKKTVAAALIVAIIFSLVSCGTKYEPVASTEEESRVVMTLSIGNKEYDVKYELYRAFFLTYKSEIDGGDPSVWSGSNSAKYIAAINERIIASVSEIYSAFHICSSIGIDVFSSAYNGKIDDFIDESVKSIIELTEEAEKRTVSNEEGYQIYLRRLKDNNLSYEASVLLYRYEIALEKIEEYYVGTFDPQNPNPNDKEGHIEYTRDAVKAFYDGDDSVRILEAFINGEATNAQERAQRIRDGMISAAPYGEGRIANYIIANSSAVPTEVEAGVVIGRSQLDAMYWAEYTEAAFSLEIGEVSEIVTVSTDNYSGYFILYKGEKSDTNFNECYYDILNAYLYNELGKIMSNAKSALASGAEFTDAYSLIAHADIAM